ncbi:unnamed protein product [Gordionus sp. m RMFG-2023]
MFMILLSLSHIFESFTLHNTDFGKRARILAHSNRIYQEYNECVKSINHVLPYLCKYQDSNDEDYDVMMSIGQEKLRMKQTPNRDSNNYDNQDLYNRLRAKNVLQQCCVENCSMESLIKLCVK